jgi:lysophospholipase L1-like esterase
MKKVVFMGDSITAGFKQLNAFPNIKNMGVGGYKSTELIPLVKELRLEQPEVLFLMIGINDFLCNKRFWPHGYTIPFEKTYDTLLDLITTNLPRTKIYLSSILPMRGRSEGLLVERNVKVYNQEIDIINQFIHQKSKAYKCHFLNLNAVFKQDGLLNETYTIDGIHLSEIGYEVYLNCLKNIEPELFKDKGKELI